MSDPSRSVAVALLAVVLVAAAPAAGAAAAAQSGGSYAGTHVSFEASGDAITGYTVGDAEVFASVETEARDDYRNRLGVGADVQLSTVTELEAAGLSLAARSETRATVETESGATLEAHDNQRGVLQVRADDGAQVVRADVGAEGEATAEGDDRVVVTTADGGTATVLVVGEGDVAVNEEGDVVAELEEGARLVVRAYVYGERDDDDREQEELIADGEAVAEVYVEERDGERVADAVTYAQDTSVEARQSAESEVRVTVERTASEGKVVLTQVHESAVGSFEDLEVRVDGEVAAEASSYSELRAATDGDEPAYMVRQDAAAEGSAQVLVALDHFSERTVTMQGSESTPTATDDGSDGDDGSDDDDGASGGDDGASGGDGESDGGGSSSVGAPGFGVGAAVVALLAAVVLARRRT